MLYNGNNRLIRVIRGTEIFGEYSYDGHGRRVKKTASGKTTCFHYDPTGNLIAETDANGTPLRDYIYQDGERVAMKIYGDQEGIYYFLNDHLGTPHIIINTTGEIVWHAAYLPFGQAEILKETVTNNFRFPGQYFDEETGLHYNYYRYYDPETGRYIRPDPIEFDGGLNIFAYVDNNSIVNMDVFGLAAGDWWDIRTYISVSLSHTWMGRGISKSRRSERKSISPLTLAGMSIDISIGILPSPSETIYEYGLGLGKHLGIGHFFGSPDAMGNYQTAGLAFHVGFGIGAPIFFSETLPDSNRPFSNLMDKQLAWKKNSRDGKQCE